MCLYFSDTTPKTIQLWLSLCPIPPDPDPPLENNNMCFWSCVSKSMRWQWESEYGQIVFAISWQALQSSTEPLKQALMSIPHESDPSSGCKYGSCQTAGTCRSTDSTFLFCQLEQKVAYNQHSKRFCKRAL